MFKKVEHKKERVKEIKVKTCTFTGHRPDKLYGYSLDNPKYQILAQELAKHLRWLIENERVKRFISGGAIGYDTVAFFVVEQMKREYEGIENILAVPFQNQFIKWREVDKERYFRMKAQADEIVYVDTLEEYQTKHDTPIGDFSNAKMQRRNEYMVDNSNYMVALWNGDKKGGTYNCVKYVLKQSHYNRIAIMNPDTFELRYEPC